MEKQVIKRRTSLATIAKIVGVSKPVVSTVLGNREGSGIFVSKHNRDRIIEAARKLGYVVPKSGRELSSGRSDNIGIILHDINPPFSRIVSHLQQEALQKNLEITVYITNDKENLEEHYLNSARDGRVDAVIALSMLDGSNERYQRFSGPPYNLKILYYGDPIVPGVPSVFVDVEAAGRLAARHLVEAGCKNPAFFSATKNMSREKGFIDYFKEKRLPVPPSIFTSRRAQVHSFAETQSFAREFLELKHLPDGVFVAYDSLAANLIVEVTKKGIRVPEDIKIIGCNNSDSCLYVAPTLTSIDLNIPMIAKKMIEKIVDMITGKSIKPLHTTTPVSLVVRESTKRG